MSVMSLMVCVWLGLKCMVVLVVMLSWKLCVVVWLNDSVLLILKK